MKKSFWANAKAAMEGKGFYIVLLLSAAALGVSGYFLFAGRGEEHPVSAAVVVTPEPAPAVQHVLPVPVRVTPEPAPEAAEPESKAASAPAAVPEAAAEVRAETETGAETATASVFTWPVKGELIRGFEVEALAYDTTMGDWRTHDGLDIAAEVGTRVRAPAGGTVSYVGEDDMLGLTVAILHADGIMSTCANLGGAPAVELGDTVLTGDVIGTVGETALAESGEEPHLHLSMTKNGVSVDPVDYLPKQ